MSRNTRDPIDGEEPDHHRVNPDYFEAMRPMVESYVSMVDDRLATAVRSLNLRVDALERRLDELTGEADTAAEIEEYDSGEA